MKKWTDIEFEPIGWRDYPSTSTKINAANLSKSENAIVKIINALIELRQIIGDDDNKSRYPTLQAGINELSNKFSGYEGYNLLDDTKIKITNAGGVIEGTIDDFKLVPGKDYILSCERLFEGSNIVLFQSNSSGDVIITQQLSDIDCDKGTTFNLSKSCKSIKVVFPASDGYFTEEACLNAQIMLTEGTGRKIYEPYTGGIVMKDIWKEILDNRRTINGLIDLFDDEY